MKLARIEWAKRVSEAGDDLRASEFWDRFWGKVSDSIVDMVYGELASREQNDALVIRRRLEIPR